MATSESKSVSARSFNQRHTEPTSSVDVLTRRYVLAMARAAIPLVKHWDYWVHRRVERVEVLDESRLGCHITMDFTVPESIARLAVASIPKSDKVALPLMLARKIPLEQFSLRDATGAPVELLTLRQSVDLMEEMLFDDARRVVRARPSFPCRRNVLWPCVRDAIRSAVAADDGGDQAARVLRDFETSATKPSRECVICAQKAALWNDLEFRAMLTDLTKQFVMFGLVDRCQIGTRTMITVRYAVERHVAATLGKTIAYQHNQAHFGASYHFELRTPPALRLREIETYVGRGPSEVAPSPAEQIRGQISERDYHLYLRHLRRGYPAVSLLKMQPLIGEYRAAFLLVLAGFAVSFFGAVLAIWLGFHSRDQIGAAVVIVIPTILGSFLLREPSHPLIGPYVRRLRAYVLVALVGAFVDASSLAIQAPSSWDAFRWFGTGVGWRATVWLFVAGVLGAGGVLLLWEVRQARGPKLTLKDLPLDSP